MVNILERFERKFVRKSRNECWPWTGATEPLGYGRFRADGRSKYAHRVSYELFKGAITDDLIVRHECDNPNCVNPNHLVLGTQKDNMRDAKDRNRLCRGEKRSKKLTETDVRNILRSRSTAENLARKYGISADYIRMIWRGIRWGHVSVNGVPELRLERRKNGHRGQFHSNAKLTPEKVKAIRKDKRPQRQIAADYGINQVTVSEIKTRKIWANI